MKGGLMYYLPKQQEAPIEKHCDDNQHIWIAVDEKTMRCFCGKVKKTKC